MILKEEIGETNGVSLAYRDMQISKTIRNKNQNMYDV
ncbi:hypothetical protein CDSM653_00869 [Caldanaerobacter subterraneus subsp. pacificus DSM 12653]|uniref:Uncharacterized protein n=1 Tax=Caldanaerobacter subterraneus subsp. pacificus DSM 12653 TaxID=391606 RepID=A0A0F5PQI7_9THEO|nr:hypothetical protein CDSM653_00869 [Caldanaerobacter subterraneus subsp. pacificus DSM 12653]